MTGRFTVLASGSGGNAALLETNGFGLLIDCGLHPRVLTARLRAVGAAWETVNAVVLTHTHGDHWKDYTLAELRGRKIPLYAHARHIDDLDTTAPSFDSVRRAGLAREYADGRPFEVGPGLTVRPVRVSHDAEPTYAFRVEASGPGGPAWSVGYASDLGCGSDELVAAFAGVDVLALEFNHDVRMERRSRRPRFLIDRVLGDCGHLSNEQAGELAAAVVARSGGRVPSHLVQLHLSRDCNLPELAAKAGRAALAALAPGVEVVTARQDEPARSIGLAPRALPPTCVAPLPPTGAQAAVAWKRQPALPGFDD